MTTIPTTPPNPNDPMALLRQIASDLTVIKTQLFGQPHGENKMGRIPMLEARVESHHKRLGNHQRIVLIATGVGLACVFFFKLAEAIARSH